MLTENRNNGNHHQRLNGPERLFPFGLRYLVSLLAGLNGFAAHMTTVRPIGVGRQVLPVATYGLTLLKRTASRRSSVALWT